MTLKHSTTVRNAMLNAIEAAIGTSPKLRIYGGAAPESLDDFAEDLLAEMTLPSDWMGGAANGVKDKAGSWLTEAASGTGTATFYRIFNSAGSTPHEQGSISEEGGGGDLIIDSASIVFGEQVAVATYTLTAGNE